MKGLSKEVKSAIIIGIVIVCLLVLGIIYGQQEKTEVTDTATTTTVVAEDTTVEDTTEAEAVTSETVTVPEGAEVKQDANGNWALIKDGATVSDFTGIASNDAGSWYIENGVVNFNYSGTCVFNGVSYTVEGGAVVS